MSKAEYHLLYILSEPPIPVAKHKVHRWIPGNVLSAPRNSAIPPSDRFVVLDGDTDGRMVALRITELQGPVGHIDDDCLYALHNGSTGEASSSPFESMSFLNVSCNNTGQVRDTSALIKYITMPPLLAMGAKSMRCSS